MGGRAGYQAWMLTDRGRTPCSVVSERAESTQKELKVPTSCGPVTAGRRIVESAPDVAPAAARSALTTTTTDTITTAAACLTIVFMEGLPIPIALRFASAVASFCP